MCRGALECLWIDAEQVCRTNSVLCKHTADNSLPVHNVSSLIGGSQTLECHYPEVVPTGDHIITWRKAGPNGKVPILIQYFEYSPNILDINYSNRLRLVEDANIEIMDIRGTDQAFYECSIVFLDSSNVYNSRVYLSINSSGK